MFDFRLLTLAVIGGFAASTGLRAQQPTSATPASTRAKALASDAEILGIIKQRVDEKRSAGIVVGVIDADGRSRVVAYGDPGAGQPALDGNSVFEIGSISKVFTATVLAQLVKEGKVSEREALSKASNPQALEMNFKGIFLDEGRRILQ